MKWEFLISICLICTIDEIAISCQCMLSPRVMAGPACSSRQCQRLHGLLVGAISGIGMLRPVASSVYPDNFVDRTVNILCGCGLLLELSMPTRERLSNPHHDNLFGQRYFTGHLFSLAPNLDLVAGSPERAATEV